jgi:protein arginine kinase
VRLKELADSAQVWCTAPGQDDDVVLWTRVRIARNLAQRRFAPGADDKELLMLRELMLKKLSRIPALRGAKKITLDAPDLFTKRLLGERRIIDFEGEPLQGVRRGALLAMPRETTSVLLNWHDHLRFMSAGPGFCAQELYDFLSNLDDAAGDALDYAWEENFGWLSPTPESSGTAMRISMLAHLPGLERSGRLGPALKAMSSMFMVCKPADGQTQDSCGDFHIIESISPFGRPETALLEAAARAARFLCAAEREARAWSFSQERATESEDEAWRAIGILQNARSISCEEALARISSILYGLAAGINLPAEKQKLLRLLLRIKPAHVTLLCAPRKSSPAERDIVRAAIIRAALSSQPKPQ